jgi:sialic acid synthase SpsE
MGKVDYGRKSSEQGNLKFRRSLYFVKDLKAGDMITADAVRSVRPGFGLAPKYLEAIIGQRVRVAVRRNTPVRDEVLLFSGSQAPPGNPGLGSSRFSPLSLDRRQNQ